MNYLVINAIGRDRPGISHQLFKLISQAGCNIIDSKIAIYGEEFTLMMYISGSSAEVTQAENLLPRFCVDNQLLSTMKRTHQQHTTLGAYRLEASIECSDRQGIVESFTNFYASRNIDIESMSAKTLAAGDEPEVKRFQIFSMAHVDDSHNLMQLQEDFNAMCQELDIQGSLNFVNSQP